ncbi:hypothetical protein M0802_006770 [Mischocyttarus mexicanus]|nr:hypothetical protein M0802_006770 [Mischocyttarus mexicanus]
MEDEEEEEKVEVEEVEEVEVVAVKEKEGLDYVAGYSDFGYLLSISFDARDRKKEIFHESPNLRLDNRRLFSSRVLGFRERKKEKVTI